MRRWFFVAVVLAASWPLAAHAQIGDDELFARLSFLLLVPLGLVQTFLAAKVSSRLPRSWTGLTAVIAFVSCCAGLATALSNGDAHTIGAILAILACLPAVPITIGLARQKMWGAILLAAALPAAAGVFIILDGSWR